MEGAQGEACLMRWEGQKTSKKPRNRVGEEQKNVEEELRKTRRFAGPSRLVLGETNNDHFFK